VKGVDSPDRACCWNDVRYGVVSYAPKEADLEEPGGRSSRDDCDEFKLEFVGWPLVAANVSLSIGSNAICGNVLREGEGDNLVRSSRVSVKRDGEGG